MRDPAPELADVDLGGARVVEVQPVRPRSRARARPVGRAAGRLPDGVAHVEERDPAPLQLHVRASTSQVATRAFEDGRVPDAALGLQVRDRQVGELPHPLVTGADQVPQRRQPVPRATPPVRQHRRAQPGVRFGSPAR